MRFENEIRLGDTFHELPKSKFQVQQADNIGHYPFYTSGDKILSHSSYNLDDEVIFLATGGKANVKFNSGRAAYSTDTFAIKGKEHLSKYLYYLLLDKLNYIDRNFFSGSGLKHLQKKDFRNWLIDFPDDVNEEERITLIISALDKAITTTEQLISKYQRIKTGLLHDLLTRGIDELGNLRDEKTHEFKDSKLGRIPVEWDVKDLSFVLKDIEAGKSPNCPDIPAGKDQWGVLKVSAVGSNGFVEIENKVILRSDFIRPELEVKSDDLLMTRSNTFELVGLVCLIESTRDKLLLCDKTLRLVINPDIADKHFVYSVLSSPITRAQLQVYATGSSGTMKNISQKSIRIIKIKLPQKEEQIRITEKIKSINNCYKSLLTNLSKLQSLKTGLMQDLLSGKVRVK